MKRKKENKNKTICIHYTKKIIKITLDNKRNDSQPYFHGTEHIKKLLIKKLKNMHNNKIVINNLFEYIENLDINIKSLFHGIIFHITKDF